LRALRFYTIYSTDRLSLFTTLVIIHSTAVAGYWLPTLLVEVLRVWLFYWATGRMVRVLITELLSRALDFFFLSIVLAMDPLQNGKIAALSASLSCTIVLLIFTSDHLTHPLKAALISRSRSAMGLRLLAGLDLFSRGAARIRVGGPSLFVLGFTITVLIWTLDTLAVATVIPGMSNQPLYATMQLWADQSFASLLNLRTGASLNSANDLRIALFIPQAFLAGALVVAWVLVQRFRRRSRDQETVHYAD
jgi:hypothetical protein